MSAEKAEGEMNAYESAIAKATLLIAFTTPEQRAELARKYPQQMGEVAAILTQIHSAEDLEQLLPKITPEVPQQTPQTASGAGSERFSFIRRFAARTPFIRRFIRS